MQKAFIFLTKFCQRYHLENIILVYQKSLKYGLIKKNSILKNLNKNQILFENRNFNFLSKLIIESLKTKIHFFSKDVYEKR